MAHSKEDRKTERIFDALIPKVEDSPIFKKREAVDWTNHPKIQKASRGVWEAQEELHRKGETRRIFGDLTASSSTLKEDRSQFSLTLVGFLILSSVLSLILGNLGSSSEHSYWEIVLILFLFSAFMSLIVASWRAYVDLYPRAWWHYWWNMRHEERESISSVEAVEYLISCFYNHSISAIAESFGHMYHFDKYREEALAYWNKLVESVSKDDIHSKETLAMLHGRKSEVEKKLEKLEQTEEEILVCAKKISREIFPEYKTELVQISGSVSDLESSDLGNVEDIISQLLDRKSTIEGFVIKKVKTLREKIEAAHDFCKEICSQKNADRTKEETSDESVTRLSKESFDRMEEMDLNEDESEIEEKQSDRGGGSIV